MRLRSGSMPWKPVITATSPCSRRARILSPGTSLMRATPCASSVMIGICQPCQERAVTPIDLQHDGEQSRRHLLAGGDDGVVLARIVQGRGLPHPGHQLVGDAGHGRDHDGHAVAGVDLALDVTRDVANPLEVGHRRAAELHHQERHDDPRVCPGVQCLRLAMRLARPARDPYVALDARTHSHMAGASATVAGPGLDRVVLQRANSPCSRVRQSASLRDTLDTERDRPIRAACVRVVGPARASSAPCTGSGRRGSASCATRCCATSAEVRAGCGRSRACACSTWAAAAASSASPWRASEAA